MIMAIEQVLARFNSTQRVLFIHDMWTHESKLALGDVDDTVNVFWAARLLTNLYIYVVNDTGDHLRYQGFMKYCKTLKDLCPTICFLKNESIFPEVDKVVLCAPLHPFYDSRMVEYVRAHTPGRKLYGQGDSPRAYNISNSALLPYFSFDPEPTLSTVDETGALHFDPITLYNTNSTNRKLTVEVLSDLTCPELTREVLLYAKHKLCFLPEKPFAVGLLLKKYGTGNTTYGLCNAKHLMDLGDMSDPDEVLEAYFTAQAGGPSKDYVEKYVREYPTAQQYFETMCTENADKLSTEEDKQAFLRALALVVECTLEWFGPVALEERFRTLADSDVTAIVDGTELYSSSMFDLIVGVSVVYDLTPQELNSLLPGSPNQVVSGPFMDLLLSFKLKKD
jgi:hypothetical protein